MNNSNGDTRRGVRIIAVLLAGLVVGVAVSFVTNRVVYGQPPGGYGSMASVVRFWGLAVGSLAALASVRGLLALRLGRKASAIAWAVAAALLGLVGATVGLWMVSWGVPPFTLEGAWMYPLTFGAFTLAALSARQARRVLRGEDPAPDLYR